MTKNETYTVEFSEFSEGSSLHGLKYIGDSKAAVRRRVIWAVFLLLTASYLTYTITTNLLKYFSYPYTLSVTHHTAKKMDMPAITFCNVNKIKGSYLAANPIFEQMIKTEYGPEFAISRGTTEEYLKDTKITEFLCSKTMWEYYQNGGHSKDEMISSMLFVDGFRYDIPWKNTLTSQGMCTTVNPFDSTNMNVSLVSTKQGRQYYLRINLNAQQDEYSFGAQSPGAGFQVLIHDPKEVPDIVNQGFMIQPGLVYNMAITAEEHIYLNTPYSSECRAADKPVFVDQFGNKTHYSIQGCKDKCVADELEKQCGCSIIPGQSVPECNMLDYYTCFNQVSGAFWIDNSLYEKCACHRPCSKTVYHNEISSQVLPSNFGQMFYQDVLKIPAAQNKDYFRDNIVDLRLYFKEFNYDVYEEIPSYTMNEFWGDIGGLMGLCLGASILSIIEIVEFSFNKMCRSLSKNKKSRVNTIKVISVREVEAPPSYSESVLKY